MTTTLSESPRGEPERDGDPIATVRIAEDRQVAYAEYGASGGTPVLFLHGTPGSRRLAALFDAEARECGIRLLALDRPGYGQSSPWPARSVTDAGTYVTAVLDDAGVERAGLLAFSGGAPHALAVAATHGDRVREVDLVAGATPPDVGDETPAIQRVLETLATTTPPLLRGLFRGQAWLAERLDPSFVVDQYTSEDGTEAIPDAAASLVRRDFVEAFATSRRGAVTEFRITADDWAVPLEAVERPVRLWHGTDDTNVPIEGVRRFRDRLPTAQLEEIEGADHLRTLLRCVPVAFERHRRADAFECPT
jgi:pimeloyl-ACP methyl ester carboxylesterase